MKITLTTGCGYFREWYNLNMKVEHDQFYTNPRVSDEIVDWLFKLMPSSVKGVFLEPSAGTGNFLDSLRKKGVESKKIRAMDIQPKAKGIKKENYVQKNIRFKKDRTVIGNPPFGNRGKLALIFLNKGLSEAETVGMILPNIFKRYSIQKNVDNDAKLIFSVPLPEDSFLVGDKAYGVKCVFQIWTKKQTFAPNLRILSPPQIRHEDFQTWIHNNTTHTLKYFNKDEYKWDFAVHRQGYYDYAEKITDPKLLVKNRQYFFIKAKNKKVLTIINKIDFIKLSKTNTQVLGFSTSDFVSEYKKLKGER